MLIRQIGFVDAAAGRVLARAVSYGDQEGQLSLPFPEGPRARVWVDRNRVSSDKKTKIVGLQGLPQNAQELTGKWVKVDGKIAELKGNFDHPSLVDEAACDRDARNCPTHPGFNQVQLYSSLTGLAIYLGRLGFDTETIFGKSKNGSIIAHADAVPDMNAWFSPQSEELTFGTSNDMWNTCGDGDIPPHEEGHFINKRMNPNLAGQYSNERGAIDEGVSDFISSYNGDPEVSEDFPPAIGRPPSKTEGLRTVNNTLTLEQAGSEVHDRGRAYGGFFWKIKEKVEGGNGTRVAFGNNAMDIVQRVAINHGAFYTTGRPRPADFVRAVIRGAEALAKVNKLGMDFAQFRQFIIAEALARGMIKAPDEVKDLPQPVPASVEDAIARFTQGDRRLSFAITSTAKGIGGSRDNLQEFYTTRTGKKAKVIAAGTFGHRDAAGRLTAVSLDDARLFGPTEVNEEIKVTYEAALKSIEDQARKELEKATAMKARPGGDIREKQMDVRIAEAAVKRAREIRGRRGADGVRPVYAILPDGKNESGQSELYYEFQMGLSLYYVSARDSRKVVVQRDVLWD